MSIFVTEHVIDMITAELCPIKRHNCHDCEHFAGINLKYYPIYPANVKCLYENHQLLKQQLKEMTNETI